MNKALILNHLWGEDPDPLHHPVATYHAAHQIVETKIKPLLAQCRKQGYLIVHYSGKWMWTVEMKESDKDLEVYAELLSLLNEEQPEKIFVAGFHTNICITELMDSLLRDFPGRVTLVEDATLGIWNLEETEENINDKYINRLITRTGHYIGATDWPTITTETLLETKSGKRH